MSAFVPRDNRSLPPSDVDAVAAEARSFVTNNWSRRVVQPVLVTVLTTSLQTAVLAVIALMLPDQPWLSLVPVFFLTTISTIYNTLWLRQPGQRPLNKYAYRGAELMIMLLLLRLYTWLVTDSWPQLTLFETYLRYPLTFFGGSLFLGGIVIGLIGWQMANGLTGVFGSLAIDQAEATYYLLPPKERTPDNKPLPVSRGEITQQFFRIWVSGGIGIAFLATVSTFELATFSSRSPFGMARLGLRPEVLLALLGYFLAGLLLLSQARLAMMKARWLLSGVRQQPDLDRNWNRISLWLILGIALVAAFLPLGSTFAISRILQAVVLGITAFFGILATLFLSLMALFFQPLLPDAPPPPLETAVPATPPPTPQFVPTPTPNDTLAIIGSSAFWTFVIVASVLAISLILRERGAGVSRERLRRGWAWLLLQLRLAWRGGRRRVRTARAALAARQRQRAAQREEEGKRPFSFFRLNALSPREQVRFLYLAAVRRAGEQGTERRQDETPLEYARDLKDSWPEAENDIETLTDAFMRARYTPQPFTREDVNPVKALWRSLRGKLRQRRQTDDA